MIEPLKGFIMLKSICFITPEYPIEGDMTNTFVDVIITEIARMGIECTVIAPFNLLRHIMTRSVYRPKVREKKIGENIIRIYAPRFFGALGHKGLASISSSIYNRIVTRQYERLNKKQKFDAVYGHFFQTGGLAASLIGKKYGVPSFVANGESSLKKFYQYEDEKKYVKCVEDLSGVISVSTKNKNEILNYWFHDSQERNSIEKKIRVIPNAFSPDEFYPMEGDALRARLGISKDDFVVAFVGRFKEHKGIKTLCEAIDMCDDVGGIFVGRGDILPTCNKVFFCGQVNHSDIVKYLNAADVFVLPTKEEGCSNAIIEAMACGLPIISSDLPFNYDVLSPRNAILVNPNSSKEIRDAIMKLKDNKSLRQSLGAESIALSKRMTINQRAKSILSFMNHYTIDDGKDT